MQNLQALQRYSVILPIVVMLFLCFCPVLGAQDNLSDLRITEVHYNPPDVGTIDGNLFEFIELKNIGAASIDISGATFSRGITFKFPPGSAVGPKKFIVLAANSYYFNSRYGFQPFGMYVGKLQGGGERVTLEDSLGIPIIDFTYLDTWYPSTDGAGFTLVSVERNPTGDPNSPTYWRASNAINGSPGQDDPDPTGSAPPILINEILPHTDPPQTDFVELYNTTDQDVDLTGWFLTDDRTQPGLYPLPAGTMIPHTGFLSLLEDNDGDPLTTPPAQYFGSKFRLSSEGEEVFLFSPDRRYSHGVRFPASENGVSFGRYVNVDGIEQFPPQKLNSFGAGNVGPKAGPVVISEIMYNALSGEYEFVEIVNIASVTVPLYNPEFPLNTWELAGVGFVFPGGVEMKPREVILLVDPTITPVDFAARYSVPNDVKIYNFPGGLQGNGETISLRKPDNPNLDVVPMITVDEVSYDDEGNWPLQADGFGPSLERIDIKAYGNESSNWKTGLAIGGTPGRVQFPELGRTYMLIR